MYGVLVFLETEPLFTWLVVFSALLRGQAHLSRLQSHVSLYVG